MHTDKTYDVAVIGGGASGMMAAIAAAENNKKVIIVEKNKRLGEKLLITGGGRCNIWNEEHDTRLLLSNYGENNKYLFSAFSRFGLSETIEFFNDLGLKTKVEARKRAFPVSERAEEVVDTLLRRIKELSVDIVYESAVTNIDIKDNLVASIKTRTDNIKAIKYIFSTGGLSRPETGSTGDGFRLLSKLGHVIEEPTPTITPLEIKEAWIKKISGTTLSNVSITFTSEYAKPVKIEGDILCTYFGMSGPLILNNAFKVDRLLTAGPVQAHVDCYPSMDEKQLSAYILEKLQPHGAKQLKNTLKYVVPNGTIPALKILLLGINFDMNTADLTKDQRLHIVKTLKNMTCTVKGLMGFEKAIVADGGINVNEINMKTMQSLKSENVYITGDLLHIRRPSGGYSLQLCWTTGYLAGTSC